MPAVHRQTRLPAPLAFLPAFVVFILVEGGVFLVLVYGNVVNTPDGPWCLSEFAWNTLNFTVLTVMAVVAFSMAHSTYGLLRWKAIKRTDPKCYNCGYNLTGNVSGICPECGEPIEHGR